MSRASLRVFLSAAFIGRIELKRGITDPIMIPYMEESKLGYLSRFILYSSSKISLALPRINKLAPNAQVIAGITYRKL